MKLFIVGQYRAQVNASDKSHLAWEFQGVFDSREKAVAACRDENYFVGEAVLNEELPHDTQASWPGAYYPRTP